MSLIETSLLVTGGSHLGNLSFINISIGLCTYDACDSKCEYYPDLQDESAVHRERLFCSRLSKRSFCNHLELLHQHQTC